jgi:hypothetical protein
MPSAAQKQMDINRRLNDLLNQKDTEIVRLTQKLMDMQDEKDNADAKSVQSKITPKKPGKLQVPDYSYKPHIQLQEKCSELEAEVAKLKDQVKSQNKIIADQAKALESLNSETDYPGKITQLMEDLRVQRDQNKSLKAKLYEEERKGRTAHAQIISLTQKVSQMKLDMQKQRSHFREKS